MEPVGHTQRSSQPSGKVLTYRRDDRGVIQWDCLVPNSEEQTTADFDEPDGDAGIHLARTESPRNDQGELEKGCFISNSNLISTTGNLPQLEVSHLSTGSGESCEIVPEGRQPADDFPPCISTGSSGSMHNDPQVKKSSTNLLRKVEAAGSFLPQYSPLTPPATPKKSPRVIPQSEGHPQGHVQHVPQVSREGSKFSFPDNVSSGQRWASTATTLCTSSPNKSTSSTPAVLLNRNENIRIISPVSQGAYPPKSPVVLSFQFDRDVDERMLKKIIKKFNDDVANEAEEIKPITLQDPPKPKQKKKQVRWKEDTITTDSPREITADGFAYMEDRTPQPPVGNDEHRCSITGRQSDSAGLSLPEGELLSRSRAKYPVQALSSACSSITTSPKACVANYGPLKTSEDLTRSQFIFHSKQNASSCEQDPDQPQRGEEQRPGKSRPYGLGETVIGLSEQNTARAENFHLDDYPELPGYYLSRTTADQFARDQLPVTPTGQCLKPRSKSPNNFLIPASPRKYEPPCSVSSAKTSSSESTSFSLHHQQNSHFHPWVLAPPSSPIAQHPTSPFLFSTGSDKAPSFGEHFRMPPTSPAASKTQRFDFPHPSPPLGHASMRTKSATQSGGHESPLKSASSAHHNYFGRREILESKFPRSTLPPAENPWKFPISPKNMNSAVVSGETNLHEPMRRQGDARRQLFAPNISSSNRTESDVDVALTSTILNYLVKKNILSSGESERLLRNAMGGSRDLPTHAPSSTGNVSSNYWLNHYERPSESDQKEQGLSPNSLEELHNRILRHRGHSMGEVEESLFARAVELSQVPSLQRSHSLPVPTGHRAPPQSVSPVREVHRKRRKGNIDIRVECEEVIERKRQSIDESTELNNPSGSRTCCCAEVEDQILQMTREAYTNIRRHDDTPEAFERFENEVQQTNNNITEALCILRALKKLCGHGRSIEHIYSGSIVFRLNCPSTSALVELWSWYKSGELLDLLQQGLITDSIFLAFNAEEIKLKVTIDETDFLTCREELDCLGRTEMEYMAGYRDPRCSPRNNENSPKPGYLTPKKLRPSTENFSQKEAFDFSRAFVSSNPSTPTAQSFNLAAWGRRSPISPSGFSEYRAGVPRSPVTPFTPPVLTSLRETMSEFSLQDGALLSPLQHRKAFQELNCNPQ